MWFGVAPTVEDPGDIQCGQVECKEQASQKLNSEEWAPRKWQEWVQGRATQNMAAVVDFAG